MGNELRIRLCLCVLCVLLVLAFVLANCRGTAYASSSDGLLGYNIQNLFDGCNNAVDDELVSSIRALRPSVLRFPGGASGNFYRYDKTKNLLYHAEKRMTIDLGHAVDVLRKIDADVLLVINTYTGTEGEAIELMQTLISQGIRIVGVELGNELYLTAYTNVNEDVTRYIPVAKKFASAIREAFPKVKIAAVAAPIGNRKISAQGALVPYDKYMEWNKRLAREDFFDAYAVHLYLGVKKCELSLTNKGRFDCALSEVDDYTNHVLPAMFSEYNRLFGNQREIWLTEWNIFQAMEYGNTLLQGIYAGKFLLKLSDLNESLQGRIKYAAYHKLADCITHGGARAFNLITTRLPSEETVDVGSRYIKLTAYYVFLMMKDLWRPEVRREDRRCAIEVQGAGNIEWYAYSSPESFIWFIINQSGSDHRIRSIRCADGGIDMKSAARYQVLHGGSLSSSRGKRPSEEEFELAPYQERPGIVSDMVIPPFSIGLLTIPKKQ